uniref:Uncharacterized protein n=1 Tax=Chromera velia CCMP2878 TaxID=1169474 RepID=A0A0G4GGG4_9ALVE|eukprot:Cvel_21788.t1-p1 / transcript=Cvel_21788.t1 / gene=Cvel_21788 / organism=Chromera_velia_CCMP2878 / gene_product=hypothetical protein / transcript_product=hypothetical protein / location=Cvel_scaffold2075:8516-16912(-) / protein_length=1681 / sequence_SO=supercontig / SO=protein_coding / is_pseudo=false
MQAIILVAQRQGLESDVAFQWPVDPETAPSSDVRFSWDVYGINSRYFAKLNFPHPQLCNSSFEFEIDAVDRKRDSLLKDRSAVSHHHLRFVDYPVALYRDESASGDSSPGRDKEGVTEETALLRGKGIDGFSVVRFTLVFLFDSRSDVDTDVFAQIGEVIAKSFIREEKRNEFVSREINKIAQIMQEVARSCQTRSSDSVGGSPSFLASTPAKTAAAAAAAAEGKDKESKPQSQTSPDTSTPPTLSSQSQGAIQSVQKEQSAGEKIGEGGQEIQARSQSQSSQSGGGGGGATNVSVSSLPPLPPLSSSQSPSSSPSFPSAVAQTAGVAAVVPLRVTENGPGPNASPPQAPAQAQGGAQGSRQVPPPPPPVGEGLQRLSSECRSSVDGGNLPMFEGGKGAIHHLMTRVTEETEIGEALRNAFEDLKKGRAVRFAVGEGQASRICPFPHPQMLRDGGVIRGDHALLPLEDPDCLRLIQELPKKTRGMFRKVLKKAGPEKSLERLVQELKIPFPSLCKLCAFLIYWRAARLCPLVLPSDSFVPNSKKLPVHAPQPAAASALKKTEEPRHHHPNRHVVGLSHREPLPLFDPAHPHEGSSRALGGVLSGHARVSSAPSGPGDPRWGPPGPGSRVGGGRTSLVSLGTLPAHAHQIRPSSPTPFGYLGDVHHHHHHHDHLQMEDEGEGKDVDEGEEKKRESIFPGPFGSSESPAQSAPPILRGGHIDYESQVYGGTPCVEWSAFHDSTKKEWMIWCDEFDDKFADEANTSLPEMLALFCQHLTVGEALLAFVAEHMPPRISSPTPAPSFQRTHFHGGFYEGPGSMWSRGKAGRSMDLGLGLGLGPGDRTGGHAPLKPLVPPPLDMRPRNSWRGTLKGLHNALPVSLGGGGGQVPRVGLSPPPPPPPPAGFSVEAERASVEWAVESLKAAFWGMFKWMYAKEFIVPVSKRFLFAPEPALLSGAGGTFPFSTSFSVFSQGAQGITETERERSGDRARLASPTTCRPSSSRAPHPTCTPACLPVPSFPNAAVAPASPMSSPAATQRAPGALDGVVSASSGSLLSPPPVGPVAGGGGAQSEWRPSSGRRAVLEVVRSLRSEVTGLSSESFSDMDVLSLYSHVLRARGMTSGDLRGAGGEALSRSESESREGRERGGRVIRGGEREKDKERLSSSSFPPTISWNEGIREDLEFLVRFVQKHAKKAVSEHHFRSEYWPPVEKANLYRSAEPLHSNGGHTDGIDTRPVSRLGTRTIASEEGEGAAELVPVFAPFAVLESQPTTDSMRGCRMTLQIAASSPGLENDVGGGLNEKEKEREVLELTSSRPKLKGGGGVDMFLKEADPSRSPHPHPQNGPLEPNGRPPTNIGGSSCCNVFWTVHPEVFAREAGEGKDEDVGLIPSLVEKGDGKGEQKRGDQKQKEGEEEGESEEEEEEEEEDDDEVREDSVGGASAFSRWLEKEDLRWCRLMTQQQQQTEREREREPQQRYTTSATELSSSWMMTSTQQKRPPSEPLDGDGHVPFNARERPPPPLPYDAPTSSRPQSAYSDAARPSHSAASGPPIPPADAVRYVRLIKRYAQICRLQEMRKQKDRERGGREKEKPPRGGGPTGSSPTSPGGRNGGDTAQLGAVGHLHGPPWSDLQQRQQQAHTGGVDADTASRWETSIVPYFTCDWKAAESKVMDRNWRAYAGFVSGNL